MKNKKLVLTLIGILMAASLSAKADILVASQSYTEPGCDWNLVYSQSGVVTVYTLNCSNRVVLTNIYQPQSSPTCQMLSPAQGYRLVGSSCSSFSLYKITTATPTPTPTPVPGSCARPGYSFAKNVPGSQMSSTMSNATPFCGSCGVNVATSTINSAYYDVSCGK